jgi:hypothetical protein
MHGISKRTRWARLQLDWEEVPPLRIYYLAGRVYELIDLQKRAVLNGTSRGTRLVTSCWCCGEASNQLRLRVQDRATAT